MLKQAIADSFTVDEIHFAHCFTAPSLRHFIVLLTGWVLTVGTHTVST